MIPFTMLETFAKDESALLRTCQSRPLRQGSPGCWIRFTLDESYGFDHQIHNLTLDMGDAEATHFPQINQPTVFTAHFLNTTTMKSFKP